MPSALRSVCAAASRSAALHGFCYSSCGFSAVLLPLLLLLLPVPRRAVTPWHRTGDAGAAGEENGQEATILVRVASCADLAAARQRGYKAKGFHNSRRETIQRLLAKHPEGIPAKAYSLKSSAALAVESYCTARANTDQVSQVWQGNTRPAARAKHAGEHAAVEMGSAATSAVMAKLQDVMCTGPKDMRVYDKLAKLVGAAVHEYDPHNTSTAGMHGLPMMFPEMTPNKDGSMSLQNRSTKTPKTVLDSVVDPARHLHVDFQRKLWFVTKDAGPETEETLSIAATDHLKSQHEGAMLRSAEQVEEQLKMGGLELLEAKKKKKPCAVFSFVKASRGLLLDNEAKFETTHGFETGVEFHTMGHELKIVDASGRLIHADEDLSLLTVIVFEGKAYTIGHDAIKAELQNQADQRLFHQRRVVELEAQVDSGKRAI